MFYNLCKKVWGIIFTDKKTLKQLTTKIYEEYGFIKKCKYYYLDLDDVLICSGFNSMHGFTYD